MSTQKDKFLASAQKYIQKGQFERALKDYEQVVTADPKDVKHRQKLAELMVRCNRREDAIREYETIAKYYDENGFNLKSIAVYKQIQRLDPSNIGISVALAQLNEKQGLIGNALSEYKTVYDHFHKAGQVEEVLNILEKMKGVDPQNVDVRMKLAETCYSAGHKDRAYDEFNGLAMSLRDKGKKEVFERVCQRIQDLFPDRKEGVLDILASQVSGGMAEDSLPKLQKLLEAEPGNTRVMALLAEAYRVSGEAEKGREMLLGILRINPADLDAIKGIIESEMEGGSPEGSVAQLQRYLPALMESGCNADAERYYTRLLDHNPYDIRLLEGLKTLYEATGEQSKLADVLVSINLLSQETSGEAQDEPEEAYPDTLQAEGEAPDFPWQDEIDLSFDHDVESASAQENPEAGPVMLSAEELADRSETTPEAARDVFDIDISFDLSDLQEMADAGEGETEVRGAFQSGQEPPGEDGAAAGMTVPDFLEGLDVGISPGVEIPPPAELPPEEDCITLSEELPEAEIVLEPESGEGTLVEVPDLLPESELVMAPEPEDAAPLEERVPGLFEVEPCEDAGDSSDQDGMVPRFKESLDSQVDSADTETRYNLGIAYMEMDLYDEAIGEFRVARNDPDRFLDCITLEGMCHGKKGDFASAEKLFIDALSRDGLDTDRILSLRYELGVLYETAGNRDGALKVFGEIFQVSPGFRDTMKKIARLSDKENGSLDLSDINDADLELDKLA